MYDLIIKRQAQKKLKTLPPGARAKIVGQIKILGIDPEDLRLDVKKMQGGTGYRLRIGQWRVLFERDDEIKIISIEKVGARGDVYK